MKLIVGLGNPGDKYQNTRHNVGFMVIDAFMNKYGYTMKQDKKFKGEIYLNKDFILLKPQTYMNLSGESVQAVKNFYKVNVEDILVISDDFNLPFLKMRIRPKGSAGGHNGLKNIIQLTGSENFPRLRIGLGSPEYDTIDFVLKKFSKDELKSFEDEVYPKTNDLIESFTKGEAIDKLMNKYNTK